MRRWPAWLQAVLLGSAVLIAGGLGLLAMSGQLDAIGSGANWQLTILHTSDVKGYLDACG